MKRFSIFCAVLFATVTSFATVTYELNGSVTNDDNWLGKGDMFAAFMTDAGATGFETLEYYMQQDDPLSDPNICTALTDASPALKQEKWAWLKAYIEAAHEAQTADGASALPADGTGSAWRYAVGAFFISGQRESWPKSADFSSLGLPAAFMPSWKHGFANPTEPTDSFELNAPYLEGESFRGWFDNETGSGQPITHVDCTTTGTLYALFGEYIPTIAEVRAMEKGTKTKVKGYVNHVGGNTIYIQDASGAMDIYMKNSGIQSGQEVVVSGTVTNAKGWPRLEGESVVSTAVGTPSSITNVPTLTALVNDTVYAYYGKRVAINGLKVAKYDSNGDAYFTDGIDTVQGYYMKLDQATFAAGTKVVINGAVAAWYGDKFQFTGDVASVAVAPSAGKDPYTYPARGENGEYTLTNNWIISNVLDTYAANKPGPADGDVRGMAAKDGKMYFINNATESFTVVDGSTGEMLEPIKIVGDHLFEVEDSTGVWKKAVTYKFNDVKIDNAGNVLIGSCLAGETHTFFIYKVDLTTGQATQVIKERLWDNPDFEQPNYRFDAFGVYGDVNANAVVMAADASSWTVYKWVITNGVAAPAEQITLQFQSEDKSLVMKDGQLNVAPANDATQIFPVTEDLFYVDGQKFLPVLFDTDGTFIGDFASCPTGLKVRNGENDSTSLNGGPNGICEFQVGDEYFLLLAASNTDGSPKSTFALYKFANKFKEFSEIEPMWFFPNAGMGGASNPYRSAVPYVKVDGNVATIYVYYGNNGYGVYTFTCPEGTDVDNVEAETIDAQKFIENGQVFIIKNGIKYNVLGVTVK